MRIAALLPAAGSGKRLKSRTPKPFFLFKGKPLLIHTLKRLREAGIFEEFVIAADPEKIRTMKAMLRRYGFAHAFVVPGGRSRAESVWKALQAVSPQMTHIFVHDAARPLVSKRIILDLKQALKQKPSAAICALAVTSTVKWLDSSRRLIQKTLPRERIFLAQTPQAFEKKLLIDRYRTLGQDAFSATDEASLFDGTRVRIRVVPGDARNIKITTPEDAEFFNHCLARRK